MLNLVLKLYNRPFGFFGLIKFLLPSLLIVATESLKLPFTSTSFVASIVKNFDLPHATWV